MATLLESTTRQLRRTAVAKQRSGRLPGLYAGVCRGGELVWGDGIGVVELGADHAPTADDQFLVASNTKTFTAVMVMQLRDEGRLALDDLLGDHVPEVSHPLTIRQCLAHVSGMAREPLGDVWETLEQPDAKTLRRDFDDVERIGRPHDHWHYSNVVYAMLGQLVEELDGRSWEESLRARLLDPLGMRRTSSGRTTTYPGASRCWTSRRWLRAAGSPARPTTSRSGRRSSRTRARCCPRTRWRRCASRRCSSTPTSGPARWASASS
jgi:CubicO group peptidase (beta-lactamase class C family)